jgi:hypothetical protein
MDFDLDTLADEAAVTAVIAEIRNVSCPPDEPPEVREQRIANLEAREERARARRAEERTLHEFNVAREEERRQQAARAAAQAELRAKAEQRQRDRDAQHNLQRLDVMEARQRAEAARQAHAARQQAAAKHWAEIDAIIEGFGRMANPPAHDLNAERIATLEAELEHQALEQSFAAEERRRAAYQERQRAAVARRESRGW